MLLQSLRLLCLQLRHLPFQLLDPLFQFFLRGEQTRMVRLLLQALFHNLQHLLGRSQSGLRQIQAQRQLLQAILNLREAVVNLLQAVLQLG